MHMSVVTAHDCIVPRWGTSMLQILKLIKITNLPSSLLLNLPHDMIIEHGGIVLLVDMCVYIYIYTYICIYIYILYIHTCI